VRRPNLELATLLAALLAGSPVWAQQPEEEEEVPVEGEEVAPEAEPPPEEDEELLEEEGPPPDRPPPKGMGAVWGRVLDDQGEPLIEVQVSVKGSQRQAFTDLDGRYRLEVPPGSYTLQFWFSGFKATEVQGVQVLRDQLVKVDEKLEPEKGGVDVIEVEEEADFASIQGQLLTRKRAANVGDAIGRAEIAKTPDRNAAEAARRVVGATIVDDRYVYVRGLGERYSNSLLDGVPLPSPEPDRQTVPLDLFPALMLESVLITKTFTPDMPGDFAGGSVRIDTRRLPKEFTFTTSLNIGANTEATGRRGLTYQGSSTDWLGIDGGTRALPDDIPEYKIGPCCKNPDGTFQTKEQLAGWGRSINAFMSTKRAVVPPDHGGQFVIGNTFDLGGGQRLGAMGAFMYQRSYEVRRNEVIRTADKERFLNTLDSERWTDKVRWGGLAGVTYAPDSYNRIHLTGLHSRSADDSAQEIQGFHEERGSVIHETRLEFVSRALTFGQIRVQHDLDALNNAMLEWTGFVARAERDQPDTRATVMGLTSGSGFSFEDDANSGSHYFFKQSEMTYGGGFDWTQPVSSDKNSKLKWGSLFSLRDRQFDARRFHFTRDKNSDPDLVRCPGEEWDPACLDKLFARENIGPVFNLDESTIANDAYTSTLNVYAGYVMGDVALGDQVRLILGPRVEASHQTIHSFDPSVAETPPIEVEQDDVAILPGASLVYSVTEDVNLRLAASRTLARPQLREIAPFSFSNYFGARREQGNPDLEMTRIWNVDLRSEWFPTLTEVVAISAYYKRFQKPIEQVIESQGKDGIATYDNTPEANLFGIEIEGRKSFDFLHHTLEDLSIIANFTVAHSRIVLAEEQAAKVTSRSRPLSRQAPYVINVALDYTNEDIGTSFRILYNVLGANIVYVGTDGYADIYEQPAHRVDATLAQRIYEGFELKLTGKNLLNSQIRQTQGRKDSDDQVVSAYRKGIGVSMTASYTY
jgi:outer membrane receptor protein involved in Fe transport